MFSGKTVLNCIKVSRNKALNGNNDCARGDFVISRMRLYFILAGNNFKFRKCSTYSLTRLQSASLQGSECSV